MTELSYKVERSKSFESEPKTPGTYPTFYYPSHGCHFMWLQIRAGKLNLGHAQTICQKNFIQYHFSFFWASSSPVGLLWYKHKTRRFWNVSLRWFGCDLSPRWPKYCILVQFKNFHHLGLLWSSQNISWLGRIHFIA